MSDVAAVLALIEQWRSAADRHPDADAAEAYRRCAGQIERAVVAPAPHPAGYVRVGWITGITTRVEILMNREGRYGLEEYTLVPGRLRIVTLPDGRVEAVPTSITAPSMTWPAILERAGRLTSDRGDV